MQITRPQLARLQVLYGQLARHEIGVGSGRDARIAWAEERLQKPVTSFSDLTSDDAGYLIDQLQRTLGVKAPLKIRPGRAQARRAGLDGRKDGSEFKDAPQIATSADLGRIQRLLAQLGWDQVRFEAFLASGRSPLSKRADKSIRTTSDANKVWWGLKRIAGKAGVWRKTP